MTEPGESSPSRIRARGRQYGEYASAEEQRKRIAQPGITWELEAGQAVTDAAPAAHIAPAPAVAGDRSPRRTRPIDRVVTVALLAYGFVNVIAGFPALVDYASYADTVFELMGVDAQLTDPAAGRPWGIAAALVIAFGWLLTAVLSWASMRRGRLSWWIPLVGALVFTSISGVLMLVPLMSDQAVWDVIMSGVGGP